MWRSKQMKRHGVSTSIGAVLLSLMSAQALAQQGSPSAFFEPEDVAPGIDHGNSDNNLPAIFQRQAVFFIAHNTPPGQSSSKPPNVTSI